MAEPDTHRPLVDLPARRLGGALREHRTAARMALEDVSKRLDYAFTPVVLHMVESGQYPLEEPQVQLLLWGYGVDADELLPARHQLEFDANKEHMAVGWTVREIRESWTAHGLLNEYLAFVYELRGAEPGSAIPLRDDDLVVLSNTIDWPTAEIRDYLIDLMFRWRGAAPVDTDAQVPGRTAAVNSSGSGKALLERLRAGIADPGGVRGSVRDTCGAGTLDC